MEFAFLRLFICSWVYKEHTKIKEVTQEPSPVFTPVPSVSLVMG